MTRTNSVVPEFEPGTKYQLLSAKVVDEYLEAKVLGIKTHLVLLGPMSFVLVDKPTGGSVTRSEVLEAIVPLYQTLLSHLRAASAEWV